LLALPLIGWKVRSERLPMPPNAAKTWSSP
jgi:hypothetical protein